MLSTVRKPFVTGRSKGVTLPGTIQISEEVTIAASDRLLVMDTTGEIPGDELFQFFVNYRASL
jgi:virulence-associated protein VagC